jgi:hypothetical protein
MPSLMKRDLSGFSPFRRPPMTEAKQQIISESEHPLHTYVIEAVVNGHFWRELGEEFSFDALQRQLAKEGYGAQAKNIRNLVAPSNLPELHRLEKPLGARKAPVCLAPQRG